MAYNLRSCTRKDYKTLAELKIPRATRQKKADCSQALYPIEVRERQENSVKIHYIGYSDEHDEWRDPSELVNIGSDGHHLETYHPYNPHQEIAYQIKLALHSGNRKDPEVRIELPFDRLLFDGGLKQFGQFLHTRNGHDVYTVQSHADLKLLLGDRWHIRILSKNLDFCYVNIDTIKYYLHHRCDLKDFDMEGSVVNIPGGDVLMFRFVRMDGVRRQLDSIVY